MNQDNFIDALERYLNKKKNASILVDEGDLFIDRSYQDFINSGEKNIAIWLEKYLHEKYLFLNDSPRWIGERDWAYLEDQPMVFLKQLSCDGNNDIFRVDLMYYIFGLKVEVESKGKKYLEFRYKMVAQDLETGNRVHVKFAN